MPAGIGGGGQLVAQVLGQVERAAGGDAHGVGGGVRVVGGEASRLLLWRAQVELRIRPPHAVALVEGLAMLDRDENVLQLVSLALVVVHVAGADHLDASRRGERDQRLVARPVAEDEVVLQLDEDLVAAEPVDQLVELRASLAQLATRHQRGHAALAATGEHNQALGVVAQMAGPEPGVATPVLLLARVGETEAVGDAGEAAEVAVAATILRQQRQV